MWSRGWGGSPCLPYLANPTPVHITRANTADTTKVSSVPFYRKLLDSSYTYPFGPRTGHAFHGQGVSGDGIGPGKRAAGCEGLEGFLGRVLVTFR